MENNFADKFAIIEDVLMKLSSLYKIFSLYPTSHPSFQKQIEEIETSLKQVFEIEEEVIIVLFNNEFVYLNKPLFRDKSAVNEFIKPFTDRGCNRFKILKNITKEELINVIKLLSMDNKKLEEIGGIINFIEENNIEHFQFDQIILNEPKDKDDENSAGALLSDIALAPNSAREMDYKAIDELYGNLFTIPQDQDVFHSLIIILKRAVSKSREMIEFAKSGKNIYTGDEYTYSMNAHGVNVSILSLRILLKLGIELPAGNLSNFAAAAMLHDIGKLLLTEDFRKKSSNAISPDLQKEYQKHPLKGAELFTVIREIDPVFSIIAFEHHISNSQGGFPDLSKNAPDIKSPHFLANIVNLANRWDHLMEGYKRDKSSRALVQKIILKYPNNFHPAIISALRQEI